MNIVFSFSCCGGDCDGGDGGGKGDDDESVLSNIIYTLELHT